VNFIRSNLNLTDTMFKEILLKKQLFNIADLRHNVLNKKEYFSLITQNKNEFELLTHTHLIKAKLKKKISN